MTEHSATAMGRQSPDRLILRRNSNGEIGVAIDDRNLPNSSESSERMKVTQLASDARIQPDCIDDDNRTESECERLNKYPDYCRTITIRGLIYFCIFCIIYIQVLC